MRIIAPVRLTPALGEKLDAEVAQTRQILDKFQKSGFHYALWAVDALPAESNVAAWVQSCLKAFPGKVILAIDSKLENGALKPPPDRVSLLLSSILKPETRNPMPPVHSVLLNYAWLNNFACTNDETGAIQAVRRTAEAVRGIAPKAFLWLLVSDEPKSADRIPEWVRAVGGEADGYLLHGPHALNLLTDQTLAADAQALRATGKPVIRGGFTCTAPRPRPGIEQELREQYHERIGRYEAWLKQGRFAGYSRLIGESVPQGVNVNMELLPD